MFNALIYNEHADNEHENTYLRKGEKNFVCFVDFAHFHLY